MKGMNKKNESLILSRLFVSLNESALGYSVLRNYEHLPESLGGSDLDIAVLPEESERVAELVKETLKHYGGEIVVDYKSSGHFMRALGYHVGEWWGIAIDLFSKIEYKGVEYISSSDVIARSKVYRDITVTRDEDAAAIALIKELLANGKTRKDYFSDLASQYSDNGPSALHLLHASFDSSTVSELVRVLDSGDDSKTTLATLAHQLRSDVLESNSIGKGEARFNNVWSRVRRIFCPPGLCVVVTGTDGAGKTTVIDQIIPVLEAALHSRVQYEHMRPNWLSSLGVATGKREAENEGVVANPHAQRPSGFLASLVRLGYYILDYTLGYWCKIYPGLVKRPCVCIFDRYFYDVLIDPKRMRMALPKWIMKLFFAFVPKPELLICLGANPEVLYSRKPETSLEEVERQVGELKKLAQTTKNAVWVDTAQSVQSTVNQVLRAIQITMASRY